MQYTGIILALLAATAYNAGLVIEKQALEQLPAIDLRHVDLLVRTLLTSPRWFAGFLLTMGGLGCQVIVLTFEPVTLVQPVLASGIVVILLLSRMVLREQLGRGELWCVAVMVIAVFLLALSNGGPTTGVGHDAERVLVLAAAVPSCLAGLLISASALRAASRKHRTPVIGVSFGVGTGLLYGVAALAIKALSAVLVHHKGTVRAAAAILASPYLYLMVGCMAGGFVLFQTALQRCRASIVVPVSNIVGSVYFMAVGTLLFQERLPADPAKLSFRLAGILAAGSVLILLPRQRQAAMPRAGPITAATPPAGPVGTATAGPRPTVPQLVSDDIRVR